MLEIVCKYNPMLISLSNLTRLSDFEPSLFYAWCIKCNNIKSVMERKYDNTENKMENLICEDCRKIWKSNAIYIKSCPGCNWKTEQEINYNYIYCENTVINDLGQNIICDTYWCWICGVKTSEEDIYRHFSREHNSFYQLKDCEWGYT